MKRMPSHDVYAAMKQFIVIDITSRGHLPQLIMPAAYIMLVEFALSNI